MHTKFLIMPLVLILAGEAHAQASKVLISRGTTICAVDVSALSADGATLGTPCRIQAYLPPGTVAMPINGAPMSDMLLTAYGLVGRKSAQGAFWDDAHQNDFRAAGLVAFVAQGGNLKVKDLTGTTPCKLTRGEWYKAEFDAMDSGSINLTITDRKNECIARGAKKIVSYPRASVTMVQFTAATVEQIDSHGQPLQLKPDAAYRVQTIRNNLSYVKQCGDTVQQNRVVKAGGGIDLDLGPILSSMLAKVTNVGLKANLEASWSRSINNTLPPNLQQEITFYYASNLVVIGRKKVCENGRAGFSVPIDFWYYVAADQQNADLKADILSGNKIRLNPITKSPRIKCAQDYFALYNFLFDSDYPEETIPFLISRIAEITSFGGDDACAS